MSSSLRPVRDFCGLEPVNLASALAREISRLSQNSRFLETEVSRPAIRGRADDDVVEELHLQHASAFGDSARKAKVRFAGS
jgi:hypothetical protein